jgi:hypothetical protein
VPLRNLRSMSCMISFIEGLFSCPPVPAVPGSSHIFPVFRVGAARLGSVRCPSLSRFLEVSISAGTAGTVVHPLSRKDFACRLYRNSSLDLPVPPQQIALHPRPTCLPAQPAMRVGSLLGLLTPGRQSLPAVALKARAALATSRGNSVHSPAQSRKLDRKPWTVTSPLSIRRSSMSIAIFG